MTRLARLSVHSESVQKDLEEDDEPPIQTDDIGRIYRYDADALFSMGVFSKMTGSALVMPELWIQFLFLALATSIWGVNICPKECDDSSGAYVADFECPSCIVGFDPSTGFIFGSLVAFMLGLFNSMTFGRWYDSRCLFGDTVDAICNNTLWLLTYIPGVDDESVQYRYQITRYQVLAMHLHAKTLIEDERLDDLIQLKLLTQKEATMLQGVKYSHEAPLVWASLLVMQVAANNMICFDQQTVLYLHKMLIKQRTNLSTITMSVETQIPYTYTHLMTIIVKFHLLFVTAVAGTYIGQGVHDGSWIDIVWGYIIVLLSNIVLEGLLRSI